MFNGNTVTMVAQITPTIIEVLNTYSNGQPGSPSCLSCALRGSLLMFREKVLRNCTSILLPNILSCLPARISLRSIPEKVTVSGLSCLIAKIGLSSTKVISFFRWYMVLLYSVPCGNKFHDWIIHFVKVYFSHACCVVT